MATSVPALYVEFLLVFTVGIDGHLGSRCTDGIDQATLDIDITVGIDAVVVGGTSVYLSATDGQVLRRVDGVVVAVDDNLTTYDVERVLALNALTVVAGGGDADSAAADDDAA